MTWVATAIIGGAVISTIGTAIASHNASNAAQQAAVVQADAASQASQLQYQMYGTTRNDLAPFRNVGAGAISNINSLLPGGLTSAPDIGSDGQPVPGTGGIPIAGGGSSPFLSAVGAALPQMGPLTQAGLNTFLPGSGSNPLQSALYSFVNGASNNPNSLLTAANNSILGGSGSPNAALANLTSYIPGGSGANATLGGVNTSLTGINTALGGVNSALGGAGNALGVYNSLLGLGPSPFATSQLKGINDSFKSDYDKWMMEHPGKTDADWAKTDQAQGYNDKLIKFYQNNPDQVHEGILQAQDQVGDPMYGEAARKRLEALNNIAPQTPQQAAANALSQTPGYQFALDQGLKATQNGFAAQGLASSGAAMKGGAQFAEGLASQTYNQQLQNYLANYNAGIAGVGANVNAAGANVNAAGANINNYQAQTGNAYNLYNGTTTNALNAYTNQANLAGTSYGQGFTNALNAYQQQFNNANTAYTGQTNVAQNLLNTGSNAAAQTGTIGSATANNAGGFLTSGAAATAGGIVGSANAVNNGLISASNNLGGVATLYGLNPSLFSGSGGGGNALGFQGYNNPVVNT